MFRLNSYRDIILIFVVAWVNNHGDIYMKPCNVERNPIVHLSVFTSSLTWHGYSHASITEFHITAPNFSTITATVSLFEQLP